MHTVVDASVAKNKGWNVIQSSTKVARLFDIVIFVELGLLRLRLFDLDFLLSLRYVIEFSTAAWAFIGTLYRGVNAEETELMAAFRLRNRLREGLEADWAEFNGIQEY